MTINCLYTGLQMICKLSICHLGNTKICWNLFNAALFHYTLGNIYPKYRSILKAVQLIAVVTCPILKKYRFEAVLLPFINDMNKLRKVCTFVCNRLFKYVCTHIVWLQGCMLTINDKGVLVKGIVLAMLTDTQATHLIGGLKLECDFHFVNAETALL